MTDSVQNHFDDISFCIGEEDFRASESVCDSDISETDSECDDYSLSDNESDEEFTIATSKHCNLDISIICESVRSVAHSESADNCACRLSEKECYGKSSDGSAKTESTLSCSSQADTMQEDVTPYISAGGYVDSWIDGNDEDAFERIRSEFEHLESQVQKVPKFSLEWFQLKEELVELNVILYDCVEEGECLHEKSSEVDKSSLPLVANSKPDTFENYVSSHRKEGSICALRSSTRRLASNKILDKVLLEPLYFSALLVVMAHEPSKRDTRFCGTYKCNQVQEDVPII